MEQKRTLWVVAAAGIFLLVVIGAALILYRPSVKDPVISSVQSNQSNAWINPVPTEESENTVLSPTAPDSMTTNVTVVSENTEVNASSATIVNLNDLGSGSELTTVRDDTISNKPVTKPVTTEVTDTVAKAEVKTTKAATTEKAEVKAPAKTSTASTTKKATTTVTEYWVQTGAFSSREYAENAQDSIASYKIDSEIFTSVVNGKTWYRVRMGPYRTHTEADYWMTVIRSDPIFADSFITEVKTQQ